MELDLLIQKALEEDLGGGDITTQSLIDPKMKARARVETKEELVLAGMDEAKKVFAFLDPATEWMANRKDGDFLKEGSLVATVKGKGEILLKGERTALNFLQRLSGISTRTRQFVKAVEGTKAKILDTRKTTPGWRALEKYAVLTGGGSNHRMGLFDRILIKNNHIRLVGSIEKALEKITRERKKNLPLEVEVRNLEELKAALGFPVDVILLDNFTPAQIRSALAFRKHPVLFEASGGITLENVREYAQTGVDFISCGALTHSAPAVDIHLILDRSDNKF